MSVRPTNYLTPLLGITLVLGIAAHAQIPLQSYDPTAAPTVTPPAFDVVSVKEHKGSDNNMRIMNKPNGYEATNLPLRDIVAQAYGVRQDLISGLPDWANSMRFDISAKVADEDVATLKKLTPRQRSGMLIPILADRFHLQAHQETRTLPTFDLVVDKDGPKLKVSTVQPLPPDAPLPQFDKLPANTKFAGRITMGPGMFSGSAVPVRTLANQLAYAVNRTVTDKTGLTGKYDIDLKWTPEERLATVADNGSDDQPGSIFTAVREQLGLRLVSTRGPVETLVVDHVEKPSEN